jgi:hypothetical protein
MPIEVELVESDSVVPKHAEVIIVGGGIIGVSTTYFSRSAEFASSYAKRA